MRAALYFAPPAEHPLSRAAAGWLGRDAWSGVALPRGPVPGFDPAEIERLTAEPRRYGFHATLKAPFRLGDGDNLADLRAAVVAFGHAAAAVTIPALRLERIGPFFALTPVDVVPDLQDLAAAVVRDFEPFRAPLTSAEIARRRPERLTERQRAYLDAWGYPYVFDEFRFHMTLTGPVPEERRAAMAAVLEARFAAFIGRPLAIDALCLFVERETPGDFAVDTAVRLGG
jgi:putative phosphonate metabolism protein